MLVEYRVQVAPVVVEQVLLQQQILEQQTLVVEEELEKVDFLVVVEKELLY
jgi:hypothetical protein